MSYFFTVAPTVPQPDVIISDSGTPYNGSVYDLICTMRVDDSVDMNITISTQWILPNGSINGTMSENISELEQQNTLRFEPLWSQDAGSYTCSVSIIPEDEEFIKGITYNETRDVIVESKYSFSSLAIISVIP